MLAPVAWLGLSLVMTLTWTQRTRSPRSSARAALCLGCLRFFTFILVYFFGRYLLAILLARVLMLEFLPRS